MASSKPGSPVAKLTLIVGLLGALTRVSAAGSTSHHGARPAAPLVTAQASPDPAPQGRSGPKAKANPFPDYGPQLTESQVRSLPDVDRTKQYSFGRRVRDTLSSAPHFTCYRCKARRCRGAELGSGGWVSIGWFDASYEHSTDPPAKPQPDGAAPAPQSDDVATTAGGTTLSPADRAAFENIIKARMKDPHPPPKPRPAPPPPPKREASSAAPAAHAEQSNPRPGNGPHLSKREIDQIPDLEHNKTSWDYNSLRKKGGMTYGGDILTAYRCDDKDGCKYSPGGGASWKPAGWYMPSMDTAASAPAAKPAKRSNDRPGDGPHLTKAEISRIPDVEGNKTSWDYNSVRKTRGMTGAGQITAAYRCDNKDGCNSRPGGGPWKPAGWYIDPW